MSKKCNRKRKMKLKMTNKRTIRVWRLMIIKLPQVNITLLTTIKLLKFQIKDLLTMDFHLKWV